MSIYKNGKLIAGGRQCMPLLSFMWADHQLNDVSWLRADTFSWHTGNPTTGVYQAVYAHLADDFNSIPQANVYRGLKDDVVYCRDTAKDANGEAHPYAFTSFYGETCKTVYCDVERIGSLSNTYDGPTSAATLLWRWGRGNAGQFYYRIPLLETIAGTEIRYFVAGDGHKIVMANQESNVAAIYNATGVAWYYIIDTANKKFKLPRSKHNKYADSLGVVGNGMVLGLKNSTQNLGLNMIPGGSLTAYVGDYGASIGVHSGSNSNNVGTYGITTDPEKSGIIAQQTQDTDQYKYLYFYVGAFTHTAIENTAGLNTELFNGKADITSILPMVAPDYANAVTIQAGTTEQSYTCPSYGFVVVDLAGFNYGYCYLKINGVTMFNKTTNGNSSLIGATGQYMVSAGDVCKFKSGYSNGETFAALGKFMFIPCKGVN